jgi:hypothetical protein
MGKLDVLSKGEEAHAGLPPSSSKEWINCGGSIRMSEGVEPERMPEAMLGTAAHSVGSQCLAEDEQPKIYKGESIMVQDGKFVDTYTVDGDMIEAVTVYTEFCNGLLTSLCELGIEQKVDLTWLHPKLWGTLDFYSYNPEIKILDVVDYKHGENVSVDVELNYQTMIYAIGAISLLREVGVIEQQAHKQIETIRLNIVQPRDRNNPEQIRTWSMSYAALETWMFHVLTPAAHRTDDPAAPLCAGPWCTWCKGSAKCPARAERMEGIMGTNINNPNLPAVSEVPPEKIARMLAFLTELGGYRKRVDAYALNMLERGIPIPGYKLVKRRSNRKWKPIQKVEKVLTMAFGQDAYNTSLVSIPEAERMAKDRKIQMNLTDLVDKPDTGNTVAPVSSKSKEVKAVPMYLNFIEDSPMFK